MMGKDGRMLALFMLQLLSSCLLLMSCCNGQDSWRTLKLSKLRESPSRPSASAVNYFGTMKKNMVHFQRVLREILIPRTSGSSGNIKVRNFIKNQLSSMGWHVELDEFEQDTVVGHTSFANIIATLDPEAPRRLVLACHYDSKATPRGFLGATDSAVPCAQLINLAYTMQMDLNDVKAAAKNITLQLIFFDGEEAFREWTATDSLYGARHLAAKLEKSPFVYGGLSGNHLDRMDVLVLLDLLGAENPTIFSSFDNTNSWYQTLSLIEDELTDAGLVGGNKIFVGRQDMGIEDDHVPFLRRGVPILHLIAAPFPSVWHTPDDNLNAVDMSVVEKLNMIFRLFVATYLEMK